MINNEGFLACLDNFSIKVKTINKENDIKSIKGLIKLKATFNGMNQTFLDNLFDEFNFEKIYIGSDMCPNLKLNFKDYILPTFKVSFDKLEFFANLLKIDVNYKKTKNGEKWVYSIFLEKDIEPNIDNILITNYVKRYFVDINGKPSLQLFNVKIMTEK